MEKGNLYKPKSLPQVSAPFSYVAHSLNDMGVPYETLGVSLDSIVPSQGFIDSDLVHSMMGTLKNGEDLKAIWLDKDNNSIDGHHRYAAYMLNKNSHIPAVRLMCDKENAIKVLGDIQSKFDNENNSEFLNAVSETDTSMYVPEKQLETEKQTIKAFRKKPIIKNSISGNFFSLIEIPAYHPYEIEFSNLLNTDIINPGIKKDPNPPMALAREWFPRLNFEEKAKDMEMHLEDFINTIVAEKARTKKIDGILYGNKLLQSIDKK